MENVLPLKNCERETQVQNGFFFFFFFLSKYVLFFCINFNSELDPKIVKYINK